MVSPKNLEYLLKVLRTKNQQIKEIKNFANVARRVATPKTKGVGYYVPHTSHLSIREQLGLSKGAYGSLDKF